MARKVKTPKLPKEKKASPLFEFLNSISYNKRNLIESGEYQLKDYNAYMINRFLSFSGDTALYAQQMNELYWIDPEMHYDYLRHGIRKKQRFFKYIKKEKEEEVIKLIAEYHGISVRDAKTYAAVLSQDEVEHIIKRMYKGEGNG